MDGDRLICGKCPGSRGPDNKVSSINWIYREFAARVLDRKFHINRRRGMFFIFYLGLGQSRHTRSAPVNRLFLAKERARRYELPQLPDLLSFIGVINRAIGLLPVSQYPQPFKFLPLDGDIFLRVFPAQTPHLRFAETAFLGAADAFFHLQFDGQAVAVPAGNIRGVKTHHAF